jgi:ABC-type multidrug transport system fused ATPase/permease subunit
MKKLIEFYREYARFFDTLILLFLMIVLSFFELVYLKIIPHSAAAIIATILLIIAMIIPILSILEKKAFPENKINWGENIKFLIVFILFVICDSFLIIGAITPPPFNSFFTAVGGLAFWGMVISTIITILNTKTKKSSLQKTKKWLLKVWFTKIKPPGYITGYLTHDSRHYQWQEYKGEKYPISILQEMILIFQSEIYYPIRYLIVPPKLPNLKTNEELASQNGH